ncbi:MAG: hypothetical protein RL213_1231 [Bacteroidota bacterium]|jgi:hypothetical protein
MAFKRVLTFLFLAFLPLYCFSDSRFQKLYGDTLDDDLVRVLKTTSGEYFLLGTADLGNSGNSKADIALYKTNLYGDLLYSYLFHDTSSSIPTDILENPDGTFTICGYIINGQQDLTSMDFFLLRIDDAGTILWENTYGIAGVPDQVRAMTSSGDGGIFLAGSSGDHGLVCKADEFGQIVWSFRMDSLPGNPMSYFNCITPTFDGGCVAAGWWTPSPPPNLFPKDLVTRFSSTGQVLWSNSIEHSGANGWARDITFMTDGGFLATGVHAGSGTPALSLYKLSSGGSITWGRVISSNGHDITGTAVFEAIDGTILAGGSSNINGPYEASLVRTDAAGLPIDCRTYAMGSISHIVDAFDGGYVMCGQYSGNPFHSEGYLIKANDTGYTGCAENSVTIQSVAANYQTTPAGQPVACQLDQGFAVLTGSPYINQFGQLCSWIGIDERAADQQPSLFPNPSSGRLVLKNPLLRPVAADIFTAQGRKTATLRCEAETQRVLRLPELCPGIYLVRFDSGYSMKLVIE